MGGFDALSVTMDPGCDRHKGIFAHDTSAGLDDTTLPGT